MSSVIRGTSVLVALAANATSAAGHTGTTATRVRIFNEGSSGFNTIVIGASAATNQTVNGNVTVNREAGLTYSFKMHVGETVTIEKQLGQTITPTANISYTPVVYR